MEKIKLHERLQSAFVCRFMKICGFLPNRCYMKMLYFFKTGKKLNLTNPQRYNEKLQWLKLYNHDPLYTTLVDKYAVKQWVSDRIGGQYVIPTLGVWGKPEDIEWDSLPDKFVLKTSNGYGGNGVYICRDRSKLNTATLTVKLTESMKINPYKRNREWPYKNVQPKIIAEQYMQNNSDSDSLELTDYKFFCFNGEVKYLFVATDRNTVGEEVKFDYYDADFKHLDLRQYHQMSGKTIDKPQTFEEMKKIASILSQGIPHVRCDLYEINGKVYFGEMTFFHHGGIESFHPDYWDIEWGKCITLPEKRI